MGIFSHIPVYLAVHEFFIINVPFPALQTAHTNLISSQSFFDSLGYLVTVVLVVNVVYFSLLYQRTPLHMAAEGGHIDTVKYLVDKKANINTKDTDEVSA